MSPKAKRTRTDPVAGPSMSQFEKLCDSVEEIKNMISKKGEDGDESDEGPEELSAILNNKDATYDEKYTVVRSVLPINSNSIFKMILDAEEGPKCLYWALQLGLNKAVAEEGATYDTSTESSALPSKMVHILFSLEYVKKYKLYDPRDNYTQQVGTAMDRQVYDWMKAAMENIAAEFYTNFNIPSPFDWKQFFVALRKVWRWTRSNNSDSRRERRRRERQDRRAKKKEGEE